MKINTMSFSVEATLFEEKNYDFFKISNEMGQNYFLKKYKNNENTAQSKIDIEYEYKILSKLKLRNVAQPIGINTSDSSRELIVSYTPGKTLRHHINENNFTFIEKQQIFNSLTETLGDIHSSNLAHQSLSPEKIICIKDHTGDYQVRLVDIGQATELSSHSRTTENQHPLTNRYFSPEQTGKINKPIDHRTDFYNLGLIMYELFTGKFPFEENTLRDLVYSHVAKTPDFEQVNTITPAYTSIIQKLLQKDAELRYQNTQSISHHLTQAQNSPQQTLDTTEKTQDGRLYISQKLYGRQKELTLLKDVATKAKDGSSQLVLVSGYSGVGKSALIKEVQKPLCQYNGHFLSGKFDLLGHNVPLTAFIHAFQEITRFYLSEPQEVLNEWVNSIKDKLGENLKVLTDVIPELLYVMGDIPPLAELQASETQNRFVLVFTDFIEVCCQKEPLIILFLDDVQWADHTSLLLLESVCSNIKIHNLMIICAYRDNEVSVTHPFHKSIEHIKKQYIDLHTLVLSPLNQDDISTLLSESLSLNPNRVGPLSNVIISKTLGNPFFVNQLLHELYDKNLLYFENSTWQWNINQIQKADISENVVDLLSSKISLLSTDTQTFLKDAAAVGNIFSLALLEQVTRLPLNILLTSCKECLDSGFIHLISGNSKIFSIDDIHDIDISNVIFKFLHDRIQQAAYSILSDSQRPEIHVSIGRALSKNYIDSDTSKHIFDIALNINKGWHLLEDNERTYFAKMNLKAGVSAQHSGSYKIAENLLDVGCKMLGKNAWQENHLLAYDLHLALLKAQYLCTQYEAANITSQELLKHCPHLLDKIPVYTTQILNFIGNNQMAEAVDKAIWVVEQLGIHINHQPPAKKGPFLGNSLQATSEEILALENLPLIQDEHAKAALKVLVIAGAPAYFSSTENFEKVCFTMLNICTEYGNSPDSSYVYAYAGVMCSGKEYYQTGYQYCQLGLNILKKYDNKAMKPQIYEIFNVHVRHWCDPVHDCLPGIRDGISAGQEIGGIEFASYNAAFYCSYLLFVGTPLSKTFLESEAYWQLLKQYGQEFCISYAGIWISLAKSMYGSEDAKNYFDFSQGPDQLLESGNLTALYAFYQSQAFYYLLLSEHDISLDYAQKAEIYAQGVFGMRNSVDNAFCLALAMARSKQPVDIKISCLEEILEKFARWNASCNNENQHKALLIESELLLIKGDVRQAINLNNQASQFALDKGYLQDHSIAKILAHTLCEEFNNPCICKSSFNSMIEALMLWEAKNIALLYFKKHPEYAKHSDYTIHPSSQKLIQQEVSTLQKEEIDTLLETLTSLSEEINEERLQEKLLQTSATTIGATSALYITTDITHQSTQLVAQSPALQPFSPKTSMPKSLTTAITITDGKIVRFRDNQNIINYSQAAVNYCLTTQEHYRCDDALVDNFFAKDVHVQNNKIRSIFCIPITGKAGVIAIIYMENNLSSCVFSDTQIEWVSALVRQSATSLENARLYGDLIKENEERKTAESALEKLNLELEKRVENRTQALELANEELYKSLIRLREAQSKLVESEKMASLGGLVAGVAHEINTPVGAGLTSATYLQNQVQHTVSHFKNGTLTESHFAEIMSISEESTNIIVSNLQRASELIRSFKRIAVDQTTEELRSFDLVECIEDTIISLRPKYKNTNIEIDIQGDKSLRVTQYSGAIAQLVTNLLVNAITHAFDNTTAGNITLDIQNAEEHVTFIFRDNGEGMPPHILEKVFEPFFTTKRGSGGSGLGMHIAYNLVQQTLQGNISVASQQGEGTTFTIHFPKHLEKKA